MHKRLIKYLILPVMAVFLSSCDSADGYLSQTGYGAEASEAEAEKTSEAPEEAAERTADTVRECVVHVGGAVKTPGVYHLPAGSRLIEAVEMAGGMTAEAYGDGCNLAQVVEDGMQYYIPTTEEVSAGAMPGNAGASSYTADGRLDINRATLDELMTLNGIGKTRAQAILDYREEHGSFTVPEDLKQVSGIGDAVYAAIEGEITVRP